MVYSSIFSGNHADMGGAIYIGSNNSASLSNVSFSINNAYSAGGDVYVDYLANISWIGGSSTPTSIVFNSLSFDQLSYVSDRSTVFGGSIFIAGSIAIDSVVFNGVLSTASVLFVSDFGTAVLKNVHINNSLNGAIEAHYNANVYLFNVVVENVVILDGGGALTSYHANFILENVIFRDCSTYVLPDWPSGGGACYSDIYDNIDSVFYQALLIMKNVSFSNCRAFNLTSYKGGGALYVTNTTTLRMNNVSITHSASDFGGAMYVYGTNATISNSNFFHNEAAMGGAILVYSDLLSGPSFLNISTTQFHNNSGNAGAIFFNSTAVQCILNAVSFSGNTGIPSDISLKTPISNSALFTITNSLFDGCASNASDQQYCLGPT